MKVTTSEPTGPKLLEKLPRVMVGRDKGTIVLATKVSMVNGHYVDTVILKAGKDSVYTVGEHVSWSLRCLVDYTGSVTLENDK